MCKILARTKDITKEEWLKLRKHGIGGSDAGAVCGLNPYVSAMDVYADKTSEKISVYENEAMKQGRDLEQYVADRFSEAAELKFQSACPATRATKESVFRPLKRTSWVNDSPGL